MGFFKHQWSFVSIPYCDEKYYKDLGFAGKIWFTTFLLMNERFGIPITSQKSLWKIILIPVLPWEASITFISIFFLFICVFIYSFIRKQLFQPQFVLFKLNQTWFKSCNHEKLWQIIKKGTFPIVSYWN